MRANEILLLFAVSFCCNLDGCCMHYVYINIPSTSAIYMWWFAVLWPLLCNALFCFIAEQTHWKRLFYVSSFLSFSLTLAFALCCHQLDTVSAFSLRYFTFCACKWWSFRECVFGWIMPLDYQCVLPGDVVRMRLSLICSICLNCLVNVDQMRWNFWMAYLCDA